MRKTIILSAVAFVLIATGLVLLSDSAGGRIASVITALILTSIGVPIGMGAAALVKPQSSCAAWVVASGLVSLVVGILIGCAVVDPIWHEVAFSHGEYYGGDMADQFLLLVCVAATWLVTTASVVVHMTSLTEAEDQRNT